MTYARSLPLPNASIDGVGVDDGVAREVQDHATAAHGFEARPVDELVRGLGERHVHRHDIRAREQIIEIHGFLHARRQLPGMLHGDRRIVAKDVHAELEGRVRDLDADCAETYHAERALRQLEADELLLA